MTVVTEKESIEQVTPRRASRWSAMLAVLALFGSGLGIGFLFSDPGTPLVTVPAVTEVTVAAQEPPLSPAQPETDPLVPGDSSEPIADVAEALLPSIVQIQTGTGVGAGVIFNADGYIMTAGHVVEGNQSVEVRLFDGTVLDGVVVGSDAVNDIALIKIESSGLIPAPLALDERPRVGQLAIALGSPWGLDSTVTSGIVSAVDRSLTDFGGTPRSMLQTDAAINPGNSGGPLVDRLGRVIGINVSIFTESGASDGVGFAVPIDRAFRVAEAIREGRQFSAGFLGIRGDDAATGSAPGAVIVEVTPGSAAALAGLEVGDLLTAIDGRSVTGILDLAAQIRNREAGDEVVLTIIRDGETIEVTAELRAAES